MAYRGYRNRGYMGGIGGDRTLGYTFVSTRKIRVAQGLLSLKSPQKRQN